MSNLYQNYRGDSAGQRPAASPPPHPHLPPNHDPNSSFSTNLVNTAFPGVPPSRPSNHIAMNGTRTAPLGPRRSQPYEDPLFQMVGKGFAEKSARSAQPNSSTQSLPPSHAATLDQYSKIRPTSSSNVFDPSEFPSLGGGLGGPGPMSLNPAVLLTSSTPLDVPALTSVGIPGPSVNGLGPYTDMYNIAGYGDVRAKAVDAVTGTAGSSEFSMQSEDFPALGGKPGPGGMRPPSMMSTAPNGPTLLPAMAQAHPAAPDVIRQGQNEMAELTGVDIRTKGIHGPNDAGIPNGDAVPVATLQTTNSGSKSEPEAPLISDSIGIDADGTKAVASPKVLAADQYGMKGLLKFVGSRAEGTDMNMLSVGVDLTLLGLDLTSPGPLYKSFSSPWEGGQVAGARGSDKTGVPQRNEEPDFKLPTCYYMQPPALKNSHFAKFQLGTVFYVFYNMPRDILQVLAAIELYNRKWMYHKDLKLWFTNEPDVLESYDRAAYVYFDIKSWGERPFHDANQSFIQGLMTEDEVRSVPLPGLRSTAS